jgi:hypothetical protein
METERDKDARHRATYQQKTFSARTGIPGTILDNERDLEARVNERCDNVDFRAD